MRKACDGSRRRRGVLRLFRCVATVFCYVHLYRRPMLRVPSLWRSRHRWCPQSGFRIMPSMRDPVAPEIYFESVLTVYGSVPEVTQCVLQERKHPAPPARDLAQIAQIRCWTRSCSRCPPSISGPHHATTWSLALTSFIHRGGYSRRKL